VASISRRVSSTVTISGRRCPLGGLTRSTLARGLRSTRA
jgi:hypothetical protein